MARDLFRKAAIDKISSPEQLDDLIDIISPKSWIIVIAAIFITIAALIWGVWGSVSYKVYGKGIILNSEGISKIQSDISGRVTDIKVIKGNYVRKGTVLAEITLKDENNEEIRREIKAVNAGFIIDVLKREGEFLEQGESIFSIEIKEKDFIELVVYSYVAAENGKDLKKGMFVEMEVGNFKKEEYGFLLGRIKSIAPYPATKNGMIHTIGNENLVSEFLQEGSVVEVEIELITGGKDSNSGYMWSANRNPRIFIQTGTLCKVGVTTRNIRPVNLIFPELKF